MSDEATRPPRWDTPKSHWSPAFRQHGWTICDRLRPMSKGRDTAFFGHPAGLSTLFFTEMWERFSYYGMRGFLALYMTKGLGFTDGHAGSVFGNYTMSVWFAAIFGGIVADRWLGQYRSVLIGGIIIAL